MIIPYKQIRDVLEQPQKGRRRGEFARVDRQRTQTGADSLVCAPGRQGRRIDGEALQECNPAVEEVVDCDEVGLGLRV